MPYLTYDQHASDSPVDSSLRVEAIVKVFSLFGFLLVLAIFLIVRRVFFPGSVNQVSIKNGIGGIEYKIPYKNTLYENFGFVQDPKIAIPLKTNTGYVDTVFLLDSGAVVSTLPLQAAHDTGVDLARAKRITLQGFSGVPAFAYLDKIMIKIADSEYEMPATFTESSTTTYILGRKGLFDDFSIYFDHEQRAITISRKNKL